MKNSAFYGFLVVLTVVFMASGTFAFAQVPDTSNSNNTTGEAVPPPANTQNTTGSTDIPPASNTQNTTGDSGVPPTSNTQNTTSDTDIPPASNTNNTTGGTDIPPASNTQNTTGDSGIPPTSNTQNTTSSGDSSGDTPTPAPSGGSGGGGGWGNGPIFIPTPTIPVTPPVQVKLTCSTYLNEYMGVNVKNNPAEVLKLQYFLKKYEKLDVDINGIFDQKTLGAVNVFQNRYAEDILKKSWGINFSTGVVFITTKTKINDIVCNAQTDFAKIKLPRIITATSTPTEPETTPTETILESEVGLKPDASVDDNIAAVAKSVPSRFFDFLKSIWQTIVGGEDSN